MSLMDKLKSGSTIKDSAPISESAVFTVADMSPTRVPMLNVALGATFNSGVMPGLHMLAGPSKHFKSAFALLMAGAHMKANPNSILLFYDSEFGTPQDYFDSFDIPMDRVFHVPVTDIEDLKQDMAKQLKENLDRKDEVIIIVDSIGNLASRKEVDDAVDGKTVADMTRAKQMKSLFRIVTPHLRLKNIPMIVINHTYKEIGLYPKDIVSGGTGAYYSSDAIWIIGRQQQKEGTEVAGWNFIINVEKSRHVREKSKIPIRVMYDGGIAKWSGMFEIAEALGYVRKPKVGWYEVIDPDTGEVLSTKLMRKAELESSDEMWTKLMDSTEFPAKVTQHYKIGGKSLFSDDQMFLTEGE